MLHCIVLMVAILSAWLRFLTQYVFLSYIERKGQTAHNKRVKFEDQNGIHDVPNNVFSASIPYFLAT